MLNEEEIAARVIKYRCCAFDFLYRSIKADSIGDKKSASLLWAQSLKAYWASNIMGDTIDGNWCYTEIFASKVAKDVDCICKSKYGCSCPDDDCDLTPVFTVLEAIAFADLPLSPAVDDAYFIISGTNAGRIATWDGADWVFTSAGLLQLIWATVTNDYWAAGEGGFPGPWFPPPFMLNLIPDIWSATTEYVFMYQGRDIQLQLLGPDGWYNAAEQTNESSLPQLVNLTGLPLVSNEGVRWAYTIGGCTYNSAPGYFDPPIEPPVPCTIIPAATVLDTVDANQEATLLPSGAYLIISNEFGVSNTWSQHVGEVVNEDASFTALPVGATVYVSNTSTYWFLYAAGWAPLFPPLTITPGIGSITVDSDYPAESAEGTRYILVMGTVGGTEVVLASGTEDQLPFVVPGSYGTITNPYATYVLSGPCTYNATVTIVDAPIVVDLDCSAITYYTYRYTNATYQSWMFTVPPGETVSLAFIAGEMELGTVIRGYDGTTDLDPPIPSLTGSFANLGSPAVTGTAPSGSLLLVVDSPTNMPVDLTTWLFQVSCVSAETLPTATVAVEDKCDESEIAITVDIDFMGSITDLAIQYSVNGGAWQVAVPSVVAIGIYAVGAFFYNDEVAVRLVPITPNDPLAIVLLGYFTNGGTCPDPCAPDGAIKIDEAGDLSDLPTPAPLDGWVFLVTSDTTSIGTWLMGEVLQWDLGGNQWVLFSSNPGIYDTSDPVQYWQTSGFGLQPYPLLPIVHLSPTGNSPANWSAVSPDVVFYSVPINTPVAIQVRNGFGPWTNVWTGTIQQLANPTAFSIAIPFTNARASFNYDTCPLIGGVVITA